MTNVLQEKLVSELIARERVLNERLEVVEDGIAKTRRSGIEASLDARADEISLELTDIDEVLRLLEAR